MGVLLEIRALRCAVAVLVVWAGATAGCPSLCSCRGGAGPAGATGAVGAVGATGAVGAAPAPDEPPAPGEPLRLRCGGPPALISELKEVDFADIAASVVSLNLSSNAISTLSRDLHLPNLQKLDLSHNQISLIESDAFYNTSGLQRLALSHNLIAAVSREMFRGLAALERLLLDHNLITTLPQDTFHHLVALKILDITENPLVCSCALVWVGEWARDTGARLAGGPRCAAPDSLAGRSLRKLRIFLDLAACGGVRGVRGEGAQPAPLVLRPARDQLVFAGDALTLTCAAPLASALHRYELRWAPPADACDVNVTSTDVLEEGAAESTVALPNVTAAHAGAWTCLYEDEGRGSHNRSVRVTVLSPGTRSCATTVSEDNKGLVSWPQALLDTEVAVPCRAGAGLATRRCGPDGAWAPANTEQCGYISNVTKLLQQFALLEPSLAQYSALNASARLAALLRQRAASLADADDVLFVARAVRNYMRYVHAAPELGSSLLDVISATMGVSGAVLAAAEARHGAAADLVRAAEDLAAVADHKQKSNLAVESFPVRAGFGGATCAWYSAVAEPAPPDHAPSPAPAPRLHCTTTNRTVARLLTFSDALIHASVQIPGSLQLAVAGERPALVLAVFLDAALFPLVPALRAAPETRAKDYYGRSTKRDDTGLEITSPVVVFHLRNGTLTGELLEPVIATLRAAGGGGGGGGGGGAGARCAVWDPATQRWRHNSTECRVLHVSGCTWVVSLWRPGAVALLARAERGYYGARVAGARFKVSHPAVYVGSLVLLGCLGAAAATYAAAGAAVRMPRRARHALVNTWLAQAALCLLYTLGIYQTEDARLCRALGLLIHYLSLCCVAWMCAAAHVAREAARPRGEERPVLGLYLCGWGGALVVCGISAAVNLPEYAGYAQCFLSSAPALAALLAPGALLLLLLVATLLLARRAAPRAAPAPAAAAPDPAPALRAQAVVLALHVATWGAGAVAVYRPLPAYLPYQEDICSILYSVCATVLGTFTLFFYGIARSDVRAQWALVPRPLRRGKRCCRTRSVVDSARPAPPPAPPLAEPRSRSGSRSSNRTTSKTNNSAGYKAGAELNGHTLPKDAPPANGKNINLVVLHRQQYRSDNSVMTCPDPPGVGPEVFYNPNQMNVAKKFFKRQREHTRRNRLELPARRDPDADSCASLPLPAAAARLLAAGAGAKLNNTNLHVPRPPNDPNLLAEEPDPETSRTDRPAALVNIYTNVPETAAPQHQVVDTRTVSAQCSLESAPRSASEHTLDTSELTEPPSAAAETTDTDSFGRYVDCRRPADAPPPLVREEAPPPAEEAERARLLRTPSDPGSEPGETASDIYCPNYQVSEVSIRSHGLYAPSPSSMCPHELGLSAEDVSAADTQYVNLAGAWRPGGGDSELDELYTAITARGGGGGGAQLDATQHSDVTLRPDSDSLSDADSTRTGTLKGTLV